MGTVKHQINKGEIKEISSQTGSAYGIEGIVEFMQSGTQPTQETFIPMVKMFDGEDRPFKVPSGNKLYARCVVFSKATISFTPAV